MNHLFPLLLALTLSTASALTVTATAYTGPGTTATGTRAGPGQVALSRDLLRQIPYGSIVRLTAVKGPTCGGYRTGPLRVTDTTNARFTRRADVWLPSGSQARKWGKCTATLQIIRRAS